MDTAQRGACCRWTVLSAVYTAWLGLAGLPAAAATYQCEDTLVEVERIICAAPLPLYQRFIGRFEPTDETERAILAAALLGAEIEALGPLARAGDEEARRRRNHRAQLTQCLERHFEHLDAAGTPFGLQWQVLSGHLQGAGEQYLIPSLRLLWREWDVGDRAAQRAQDDAARLVLEAGFPAQRRPPPLPSLEDLRYRPFETPEQLDMKALDQLAVEVLFRARQASIATRHIEWGGFLLLEYGTHYRAPRPVPGRAGSIDTVAKWEGLVRDGFALKIDASYQLCGKYRIAASYHVHPPLRPTTRRMLSVVGAAGPTAGVLWHQYIEWFSTADVDVALEQGVPEYIITPSCRVRVLTPSEDVSGPWAVTDYAGGLPAVNWTRHVRTVPHDRDCDPEH
jgi:hypothetical protein